MRPLQIVAIVCAAGLTFSATAFADVQLTIHDGQVSLVAKDATLRQILTEWARVGQTKIVNVERIPGGPVTLELKDVPEEQALDTLLRSVSGYLAAPRAATVSNASRYDRIIVMPTSAAPRAPVAPAAPTTPAPFAQPSPFGQPAIARPSPFPQPPGVPVPGQAGDQEDDQQLPIPNGGQPQPRGPVFNTFPQPQVVNPQPQGVPAAFPGVVGTPPQQAQPITAPPQAPYPTATPGAQPSAPLGVAVPGMIVQPPPQTQPGQPIQPPRQPDR